MAASAATRDGGDGEQNFEFAFNSSNFSDRVLRIEIVADGLGSSGGGEEIDLGRDLGEKEKESAKVSSEHTFKMEDCHQEVEAMIEESQLVGGQYGYDSESNDSPCSMDLSQVIRVKSMYISSAILASKSPFFYKLFSNGMKESDQRHATLRISTSEEDALMELLVFIYSGKLNTTSPELLLDVLMAADKYEVVSCMRHCCHLLSGLPMTKESALLYLDLPSSVSVASAVQPLTDAAKDFFARTYRDLSKFQNEVISLPLAAIEAIVSSNDLVVAAEDAVYDFVLKWARTHYRTMEERRQILGSYLLNHVRFPYITVRKLKKILAGTDLDHEVASKFVIEAVFFKAESLHRQRALAAEESHHKRFIERVYRYRPLKIIEFDRPHPQCIVYLDLRKDECASLFPSGRVYSQGFHLGRQGFFLSAHCNLDQQSSFHCFGLFLGMQEKEKGAVNFTVDYEFAARTKPSNDFVSKYKGCYTFTGGKAVGYRNLFSIPWNSFTAEDSPFFINDILHLRAELTIKPHSEPPSEPPAHMYVG